ncbi:MAG: hypothetical protein K2O34_08825 [Acetatifactor sp.]|nr:hypothetical protein [Acetatifactor sp.]
MRELLQNALNGPKSYFQSNYMIVLVLGLLLYFLVCEIKLQAREKRLIRLTIVLLILILFPVSAAALMLYQSRFFGYCWIWSLLPVTLFISWGSVSVLWKTTGQNRRDDRAGWRLLGGVAVLLALMLLTGNMGSIRTVSDEQRDQVSRAWQVAAYLQELPETEGTLLWAPSSVLEAARQQDGGIKVLYGRNMWEPEAAAYAYDTYPMEQQRLYDWMEALGQGEAYEAPIGLTVFLEDIAGYEIQGDQSHADAYMLLLAAECGTRIWVFPAEEAGRIAQACGSLSDSYGIQAQPVGEVAGYMIWVSD